MKSILGALLLATLVLLGSAFGQGSGIGSLPATTGGNSTQTVKPGEEHKNKDGASAKNNKDSKGDIKITPKEGDPKTNIETRITFKNGAKGSAKGLDNNDNVDIGPNCDAQVSGDGGTVNVAGGSKVTVTNTAAPGGDNITVNTPNGGQTVIPPGNSGTVIT